MSDKPIPIKQLSEMHPDKLFVIITDHDDILRAADCLQGGVVKREGGWVCLCFLPPAACGKKTTTFVCTEEPWQAAHLQANHCLTWAF